MNPLIFFDINGTLIERDARTDLPFSNAVDKTLHLKDAMSGVNTAARSDQDVFREVLSIHHLTYSDDLWKRLMTHYQTELAQYQTTDIWRPNVDCIDFLSKIAKTNVDLSMITGELAIGAAYKLKKIGVWHYFNTGGFGEDGLTRFEIADRALLKAEAFFKKKYDQLWVIGDTILDIKTARHLGAKVIAITTGANTRDELASYKPDYIIDQYKDLPDLF